MGDAEFPSKEKKIERIQRRLSARTCCCCHHWQQQVDIHTKQPVPVGECRLLAKSLNVFNTSLTFVNMLATPASFGCSLFQE